LWGKKPSKIAAILNKKSGEITKIINRLLTKDIISKRGVFNYINDPFFLNWLKFVLSRKQNSFETNIHNSLKNFEVDIKLHLNQFINESKKQIGRRLKELFELFENDIIEVENKRFMLTNFDTINITPINSAFMINARKAKKCWLCYVEENYIDESNISHFLEKIKIKDCSKKILIALNGIDVNAKLKALEAKTLIWDKNTLNELFTIFEKPRFIN